MGLGILVILPFSPISIPYILKKAKELEIELIPDWYKALRKDEDRIANKVVDSINLKQHEIAQPDPDDLTIENAYKTRWIWYHTILGGLMFFANIIMLAIFLLLAIKL